MSIITKTREKTAAQTVRELGKVVEIPVGSIFPNPDQPRKILIPKSLPSLQKAFLRTV